MHAQSWGFKMQSSQAVGEIKLVTSTFQKQKRFSKQNGKM